MSKIIPNTKKKYSGPWLLSVTALYELDSIFDDIQKDAEKKIDSIIKQRLEEYRTNLNTNYKACFSETSQHYPENIENYQASKNQYIKERLENHQIELQSWYKVERSLSVKLKQNKTIESTSFHDIAETANIENDTIENFLYDLRIKLWCASDIRIRISLEDVSLFNNGTLTIETSYTDDSIDKNAFLKIVNWINKYKLNIITRTLNKCGGAVLMVITSLFISFIMLALLKGFDLGNNIKDEAHTLIEQGIDASNINKAVELLLKKEFSYKLSTAYEYKIDEILFAILIYVIILCLVLTPKTVVQMGEKGDLHYKFWMWWHKYVLISMSGAVAIKFIISMIPENLRF